MALELRKRFSLPLADFHEMIVAPWSKTSMDSPVGRLALTRELSSEMETCGVGMVGETGMADGFLDRSMTRVGGRSCFPYKERMLEGQTGLAGQQHWGHKKQKV